MSMTHVYGHNKLVYNGAANDLAKAGAQGTRYIGYRSPQASGGRAEGNKAKAREGARGEKAGNNADTRK